MYKDKPAQLVRIIGSRESQRPPSDFSESSSSNSDLHSSSWAPTSRSNQTSVCSAGSNGSNRIERSTSTWKQASSHCLAVPGIAELGRYTRLLERLRWKCTLLIVSHRTYRESAMSERWNAGIQFKLDFFEFYALLERTLVYLLGLFRISVAALDSDRQPSRINHNNSDSSRDRSLIGNAQGPSNHRFHANVLHALSEPGPLHDLLGRGPVLENLILAKNLRNKWKEAGERLPQVSNPATESPRSQGDAANKDDKTPDVPPPEVMEDMMISISDGMVGAKELLEYEIGYRAASGETYFSAKAAHGRANHRDQPDDLSRETMFDSMEDVMEID